MSPTIALSQVINNNKTLNFVLAPVGTFTFSGHIYDASGAPLQNQTFALRDPHSNALLQSTTTDSNGFYTVNASANTYRIQITGKNSTAVSAARFYNLLFSDYVVTQSNYVDFQLPFKKVDIHVQDSSNAAVPNVQLSTSTGALNSVQIISGLRAAPLVISYYDSGTTDVGDLPTTDNNGNATLWLFTNSSAYTFTATPQAGSGYITTNVNNITITGDTLKTIVIQQNPKILTGHIYDPTGVPLANQTISFRTPGSNTLITSTTTDNNGTYSLSAVPNSYNIQISASDNSPSVNAPKSYNLIIGQYSLSADSTLDFTLPFKKTTVHVKDTFNTSISNVSINTQPTSPVNSALTVSGLSSSLVVSYYDSSGVNPLPKTDNSGNAILWLFQNGSNNPYSFIATPQSGNGYSQGTLSNIFINADNTQNIILQKPVTLTGHIYSSSGAILANQTVALRQPGTNVLVASTTSDSLGAYSISTNADTYTVQVTGSNNVSIPAPRFYNILLSNYSLTSSGTLDLTLPFKKIDFHVQDNFTNPISNVQLSTSTAATNGVVTVSGLSASLLVSYYDSGTTGVGVLPITDNNGNATLWLLPNDTNYPYTVYATPLNGSIYSVLVQNFNVSNNHSELLSLQYDHDTPVTTASLATDHGDGTFSDPTTVTLSATAASGYSVANTYYTVDGGSQQTYSAPFTVTGNGSHTITYWSVDNSGAQETHNSKTFTILATYSLSGTVYNDANQNGFQDTAEIGYSGATVTLDSGQSTTTDSNGNYSFSNLSAGTYVETLTLPGGYTATTTNPATVALSTDTTQNFGIASAAPTLVTAIDAGGDTQGNYVADTDYSQGTTYSSSASVDTSGVDNPAPEAVYQTVRYGYSFSYTIPNLTANGTYTVRLHFNELYWGTTLAGNSGGVGSRVFNVKINQNPVLSNYDIYEKAGGANKAIVEQIPATADNNGNITINFDKVTDNAIVNGIELHKQ